jgi:hypothetical protein
MKNKVREVVDLIAPLCNSCGFELNYVQVHLVCIRCKQEYSIIKGKEKGKGLDDFFWR